MSDFFVMLISANPVRIDPDKSAFCGECAFAFPDKIKFTSDYKISTNKRENLIVKEGDSSSIQLDKNSIREKLRKTFNKSLKLRQVETTPGAAARILSLGHPQFHTRGLVRERGFLQAKLITYQIIHCFEERQEFAV